MSNFGDMSLGLDKAVNLNTGIKEDCLQVWVFFRFFKKYKTFNIISFAVNKATHKY